MLIKNIELPKCQDYQRRRFLEEDERQILLTIVSL
jgi:hypothetical protein